MRHEFILAALALLTSPLGYANAEPLNDTDKLFIYVRIFTLVAIHTCGAKEIDGGLKKLAERTGVDYVKVFNAISAAYNASVGSKYNREDLIPTVTVAVNSTIDTLLVAMTNDRAGTCANIFKVIKDRGTIE